MGKLFWRRFLKFVDYPAISEIFRHPAKVQTSDLSPSFAFFRLYSGFFENIRNVLGNPFQSNTLARMPRKTIDRSGNSDFYGLKPP